MRLLLTSGGLRHPDIVQALLDLAGRSAAELKVAFIPTALNVLGGDKRWAVEQLVTLSNLGVAQLDVVDISALPRQIWLPRLEDSHVLYVNGGHTTHLMQCVTESGLAQEIPRLLRDRVYVGVSAGSYIATPDTRFNSDGVVEVLNGLGLVDFGLQAHLNSPTFALARDVERVRRRVTALACPYPVYALEDTSALAINGKDRRFVGPGQHLEFPPLMHGAAG